MSDAFFAGKERPTGIFNYGDLGNDRFFGIEPPVETIRVPESSAGRPFLVVQILCLSNSSCLSVLDTGSKDSWSRTGSGKGAHAELPGIGPHINTNPLSHRLILPRLELTPVRSSFKSRRQVRIIWLRLVLP